MASRQAPRISFSLCLSLTLSRTHIQIDRCMHTHTNKAEVAGAMSQTGRRQGSCQSKERVTCHILHCTYQWQCHLVVMGRGHALMGALTPFMPLACEGLAAGEFSFLRLSLPVPEVATVALSFSDHRRQMRWMQRRWALMAGVACHRLFWKVLCAAVRSFLGR